MDKPITDMTSEERAALLAGLNALVTAETGEPVQSVNIDPEDARTGGRK